MATFTIQDNSNAEEEAYYRAPGQQTPATPTALEGNVNFASLDSLMADLGNIVSKDGSDSAKGASAGNNATNNKSGENRDVQDSLLKYPESQGGLNGLGIEAESVKRGFEHCSITLCQE